MASKNKKKQQQRKKKGAATATAATTTVTAAEATPVTKVKPEKNDNETTPTPVFAVRDTSHEVPQEQSTALTAATAVCTSNNDNTFKVDKENHLRGDTTVTNKDAVVVTMESSSTDAPKESNVENQVGVYCVSTKNDVGATKNATIIECPDESVSNDVSVNAGKSETPVPCGDTSAAAAKGSLLNEASLCNETTTSAFPEPTTSLLKEDEQGKHDEPDTNNSAVLTVAVGADFLSNKREGDSNPDQNNLLSIIESPDLPEGKDTCCCPDTASVTSQTYDSSEPTCAGDLSRGFPKTVDCDLSKEESTDDRSQMDSECGGEALGGSQKEQAFENNPSMLFSSFALLISACCILSFLDMSDSLKHVQENALIVH